MWPGCSSKPLGLTRRVAPVHLSNFQRRAPNKAPNPIQLFSSVLCDHIPVCETSVQISLIFLSKDFFLINFY